MTLPDKEIELLRNEHQQLSIKTSRFALLQVSLLAFIVFAFANAFRQIQIKSAPEKIEDVRTLASITRVSDWDLGVHPLQEFFLLRQLFVMAAERILLAERIVKEFPGYTERAQQVLKKYFSKDQTTPEDQKQAMVNL